MSDTTRIYFGALDNECVGTARPVDDVVALLQYGLVENRFVKIDDGMWVNPHRVAFVERIPERKES